MNYFNIIVLFSKIMKLRLLYIFFSLLLLYHISSFKSFTTDFKQPDDIDLSDLPSVISKNDKNYNLIGPRSDNFASCLNQSKSSKLVLLFNDERKYKRYFEAKGYEDICPCKNCIFTTQQTALMNADAVIFHIGVRMERMGEDPPIPHHLRNPKQVWIFMSIYPPVDYYNFDYQRQSWYNTMNWSLLYRLDADIPNARGYLLPQETVEIKNYKNIYKAKTRNALWLSRQCQSQSARRQFINEMMKQGFEVDMLGECGTEGEFIPDKNLQAMIPTYKYYLAFEKELCNDFISDKFFRNYNHDWILVVRGGADYHQLLPTDTYINTADFKNITYLVNYLTSLGNDEQKYTDFLIKKDRYKSIMYHPQTYKCEICKRLNNLTHFEKSYSRIDNYVNYKQCVRATDI